MNDKQPAILIAGGALLVMNLVSRGQGAAIWDVIWNGAEHPNVLELQKFMAELLFLALLVFLAGISPGAGDLGLTIIVGLWVVFLISRSQQAATTAKG